MEYWIIALSWKRVRKKYDTECISQQNLQLKNHTTGDIKKCNQNGGQLIKPTIYEQQNKNAT